ALGLRLLGGSDRVLWVVPSPGDTALDEAPQGLWDVLPRNLTASVVLLAAAVLAAALWQGRRLTPVVAEPLPAVVHPAATPTASASRPPSAPTGVPAPAPPSRSRRGPWATGSSPTPPPRTTRPWSTAPGGCALSRKAPPHDAPTDPDRRARGPGRHPRRRAC